MSDSVWAYYQHLDGIQHQRHGIFIVAQSILFGAIASTEMPDPRLMRLVVCGGIATAVLWVYLANILQRRMRVLLLQLMKADDVFREIVQAVPKWLPSGQLLLNTVLPSLAASAWLSILLFW